MQSPDELYSRAGPPPELPEPGHFVEGEPGEGKFYDAREAETEAQAEAEAAPAPFSDPEPSIEDLLAEFDPRWMDEMEGLLFVGRVTHQFNLAGHRITIATPEAMDSLKVALLIKDYQDTAGALRALTIAAVATCLVKVDNHELPRGIMADGSDDMQTRFDWVSRLHTSVIDGIYREYENLEVRVNEAIQSLGKEAAPEMAPSIPG
jgi:hypothetical protein